MSAPKPDQVWTTRISDWLLTVSLLILAGCALALTGFDIARRYVAEWWAR